MSATYLAACVCFEKFALNFGVPDAMRGGPNRAFRTFVKGAYMHNIRNLHNAI